MKLFKLLLLPVVLVLGTSSVFAQGYVTHEFDGYYRLKSQFRGEGECLESNDPKSSVHGGAAFMDKCQNVTGQMWKLEAVGDGYYRLKSKFRGEDECLESNQSSSTVHGGATFMDKCQNVSGQLWRLERAGKDYYRLLSQFRGKDECLESNDPNNGTHAGNPFMDKRQNVTGQKWKLEKIPGTSPKYKVGDEALGGIVFKVNASGEHGWICAKEDLSEKMLYNDAVKACKALKTDGFVDWRMPNKNHLIMMHDKLHKAGKGNFHASDFHWSSNTDGVNNFFKRFHNAEEGMYTINGHYGGWIRPVRSF